MKATKDRTDQFMYGGTSAAMAPGENSGEWHYTNSATC